MLSAWANNAGSYGAYYSIGDRVFRPFWKARGRRSRSGLTFEVIGHSSKEDYGSGKVHGLRLQWSEL